MNGIEHLLLWEKPTQFDKPAHMHCYETNSGFVIMCVILFKLFSLKQRTGRKGLPDSNSLHDRYNRHVEILERSSHASPTPLIFLHTHKHTFTHSRPHVCAYTRPGDILPSLWSREVIYISQKIRKGDILEPLSLKGALRGNMISYVRGMSWQEWWALTSCV